MKHALGGLFEVFRLRVRNLHKRLWIAICKREPRTLDLHHNSVPPAESVVHVWHRKIQLRHFPRRQRLWFLPAISESRAHRFTAQELLVSTHAYRRRS